MNQKSSKTPPPIIFILFGLVAIFGWNKFKPLDRLNSDGDSALEKSSQILSASTTPKSLSNRFSFGDKLLIAANATKEKQQGISAFGKQNNASAINYFEQSLAKFPNDPESRIYLNNAQVANQQPVKIAAVVPIGSNLDVAQEMLRGIAQAQTEFNQQGGNLQVQIINDENSSDLAKQVAQTLVQDPSILAVIGSNASNASLAAAPIYQQHGLVMITPTSTSGKLSNFGSYVFRAAPTKAIALALQINNTRSGLQNVLRDSDLTISGANSQVQFLDSGDRNIESALVKVKANPEQGYYFELLK